MDALRRSSLSRRAVLRMVLLGCIACDQTDAHEEAIRARVGLREDARGCYALVDSLLPSSLKGQLLLAFRRFQLKDDLPEGPGKFGLRHAMLADPPIGAPRSVAAWSADSTTDTVRVTNFLTVASATLAISMIRRDTLEAVLYSLREGHREPWIVGTVRVRREMCPR